MRPGDSKVRLAILRIALWPSSQPWLQGPPFRFGGAGRAFRRRPAPLRNLQSHQNQASGGAGRLQQSLSAPRSGAALLSRRHRGRLDKPRWPPTGVEGGDPVCAAPKAPQVAPSGWYGIHGQRFDSRRAPLPSRAGVRTKYASPPGSRAPELTDEPGALPGHPRMTAQS
jgi:hypothetical protein